MSLATMKRKTLNGNPRLAPVSGSNNGKFGFSLNGTRRNIGGVGVTNLAPGAMRGPSQMIGSTPSRPTGPGIHGHSSSVCTNDPTVVKTSVINTRGMLSRRANGFSRAVPIAPSRGQSGCGLGPVTEEALEYQECKKICPPIWVKTALVPNGDQSQYISRVVRVRGNTRTISVCDSNKSHNGIIGYVEGPDGGPIPLPKPSCDSGWGLTNGQGTGWKPLEGLLFSQDRNFIGTRLITGRCNTTKPGITTIGYADYNSRRVLINNCLPATGKNAPIPTVTANTNTQCRIPNPYNVNVPVAQQGQEPARVGVYTITAGDGINGYYPPSGESGTISSTTFMGQVIWTAMWCDNCDSSVGPAFYFGLTTHDMGDPSDWSFTVRTPSGSQGTQPGLGLHFNGGENDDQPYVYTDPANNTDTFTDIITFSGVHTSYELTVTHTPT